VSSEPKPPIWARPEPRGRGPHRPLSRAQIVETALDVADAEGLEAVSIRRIARELRSGTMSLYHYFDSRDELLELMADAVAGEMLVPDLPADWRAALEAIAHHTHETFRSHPWLFGAVQERRRVTPNLLRHIEQTAQAVAPLAEAGVDPALLSALATAVDDYTIGHTVRELAQPERATADRFDDHNVRYLIESGEFPLIQAFVTGGARAPSDGFETGLECLLDGFAARLPR
jgi:AcrR family transcriptional regulator